MRSLLVLAFVVACMVTPSALAKRPPPASNIPADLSELGANATIFHVEIDAGGLRIVEGRDPDSVANVYYNQSWFATGQNFMQIRTNPLFDSKLQAYAAGFLEGFVTAEMIALWLSTDIIYPDPAVVPGEHVFVDANLDWLRAEVAANQKDPWFFQAGLLIEQVQGLTDGYALSSFAAQAPHNFSDMWWNTLSAGDLDDMPCVINPQSSACEYIYAPKPPGQAPHHPSRRHRRPPPFSHCSGFVKLTDYNKELLVAHSVWDDYNSMIRIIKRYDFGFAVSAADASLLPAPGHLLSSYPGVLISGDDFWVTSQGLVLISSEIGPCPNASLYSGITPNGTRWEFMRQIIAARLAVNASEFARWYTVSNSGTFNSEWIITDYKQFLPGVGLSDEAVWYLAQIPTLFASYDITDVVRNQGWTGTFNIPLDANIYNVSGWPAMWAEKNNSAFGVKYANLFTYNLNPRFCIATRDHRKIQSAADMRKFIRFNQYKHDSCALGPGDPPRSPWHAISARADLVNTTGTYPDELHPDCFGGNDGKTVDREAVFNMNMWTQVGPSFDNQPVFSFSGRPTICDSTEYPHAGLPDKWHFQWSYTAWPL